MTDDKRTNGLNAWSIYLIDLKGGWGMILDIKWVRPDHVGAEMKLMVLVAECAGWDESGNIHTTGKAEWEEVREEPEEDV